MLNFYTVIVPKKDSVTTKTCPNIKFKSRHLNNKISNNDRINNSSKKINNTIGFPKVSMKTNWKILWTSFLIICF